MPAPQMEVNQNPCTKCVVTLLIELWLVDDDKLLQEHGDDGPIRRAPKVGDGEVVVELAFSLAAGNGRSGSRRLLCSLCKTRPP